MLQCQLFVNFINLATLMVRTVWLYHLRDKL